MLTIQPLSRWRRLRAALAFGAVLGGALPAQALAAPPAVSVRYTFDAGPGSSIADVNGRFPLRPGSAAGGALAYERRGAGWAVRYPARCAGWDCPRVILESGPVPHLNPGSRRLRFGAAILMTRADTARGANVVQKGYSTGGGTQFKLQVDGAAGRPSCVLASRSAIYRVVAPVGVADGTWHALACHRTRGRLGIAVDGAARGDIPIPVNLSIGNNDPLRIGGKNVGVDNDQYAGRIDDVFVSIE